MSDFCIEEESTQAKAKIATDAIENIIETMMRAENYINYAISLINKDEELNNLNFPSQRAFYDKLREDKDKLSRFGKICSQYDDEVDKPFTKDYEKLVAQISDIKSEEITVPNNIGATEVEYYKDERNGGRDWKSRVKLKDTISFEDVLSYGDIGELMKKNYEQYCISLEGKEGNEKGEDVPPKFEEYLNELIHQGEFDYKIVEPWQEYVSLAIDCIPVIGDGKAIIEAALGREFFTGRELSSLERGLCLISIIPFFGDGAKIFGKGAKELTEVGLKRGIRFNSKVFGTELLKNVAIISGTTTLSSIGINPLVCMVLYSGGKGAKGTINLIQSTDLFKNFELPKRNFLNTIKFKSNKVMEYLQDSKLINGEYHITLKEKVNGVVGIILKEADLTPLERFGCSIGCFTEETLVLTEKGFKRIKEISESDRVLSQNEDTGEQSYQVAKLIRKKSKEIVSVKINGQIINATIEHPFMTDQGWVKAGELHDGSKVLNSRKEYEVVESIEYKGYNEIEVYNLIVENYHTFFITELGLMVHNIDCKNATLGQIFKQVGDNISDTKIKGDFEDVIKKLDDIAGRNNIEEYIKNFDSRFRGLDPSNLDEIKKIISDASKDIDNHSSSLFKGTEGAADADIIADRVSGFDLTPKEKPYNILGSKKMSELKGKIDNRTITKDEWNLYDWNKRFKNRRDAGVDAFWEQERQRILNGERTTRNWSNEQIEEVLNNNVPKYNGKAITGHHSYSASKYPHLADKGEVIYPATFNEHLNKWHGRNYRNSNPGSPINPLYPDDF